MLLATNILIALIISGISVYSLNSFGTQTINDFKTEYKEATNTRLQHIVENALAILESYQNKASAGELSELDAQKQAYAIVESMRYSEGRGYLWINNTELPYPKMIMHPVAKQLNNTILKNEKYNCAMGKSQNLFQAAVELSNSSKSGDAIVDYLWPDPNDKSKTLPKASYVKQFKPWNLVIGTGVYIDELEVIANKKRDEVSATIWSTIWMVVGISLILIVLFIAAGLVFVKDIRKRIRSITASLSMSADQVSAAADHVSSSSQTMASSTSEQAASSEEISSTVEEMTAMTKQNAENAREAQSLSEESNNLTKDGKHAMDKMSQAITEIKGSSDETAKIIKNINEIAFQTNLLALNAAVEAARAGDAGKGFAVVAEEVRNLAQRSAEAANTTAELIEQSQRNTDNGVEVTQSVHDILTKVDTAAAKVNHLIREVSVASEEQANGLTQVNTAITSMEEVVQGNAATAEESASASEELSAQANVLNKAVEDLSILFEGVHAREVSYGEPLMIEHSRV